MIPFIDDPDFSLYVGDVREVLAEMSAGSVNCCVTSPPYWGLRDYGADGQIGLEQTPAAYVAAMVEVFREVRRVLSDDGTLWLNLGDSYASDVPYYATDGLNDRTAVSRKKASRPRVPAGLKPKDLVGIPWRVAFALQADGWYLRSDIVWSKPNPMPESVTDRPTKAHEYVFLLSKSPRYYFDQEAVREPHAPDGRKVTGRTSTDMTHENHLLDEGERRERWPGAGRNIRSVWEIATQPYPEAHFATFPEELPRRCIAAGCPEWVCATCGKARERIMETRHVDGGAKWAPNSGNRAALGDVSPSSVFRTGQRPEITTTGWSDCGHDDYRPGVVLDPFMGSGTTALVARKLGRRAVGIELSPEYAALCARRLQQQSLFA